MFGGFHSGAVPKQDEEFYDPTIFAFSFESHGRCETPQRFHVKEELKMDAYVKFWKYYSRGFVWFGVRGNGGFFLGNERSNSYFWFMSNAFEGLADTTLTGKDGTWMEGPDHHCSRLVAILLE